MTVITHLNAPKMQVPRHLATGSAPSSGTTFVQILNTDRITWNGQPIAVVVADTEERAEAAASLVGVTYARDPAITSFEASIPHATCPGTCSANRPKSRAAIRMPS